MTGCSSNGGQIPGSSPNVGLAAEPGSQNKAGRCARTLLLIYCGRSARNWRSVNPVQSIIAGQPSFISALRLTHSAGLDGC